MKRASLNRHLAKQEPERVFDSPFEIVGETLLTRGEKLGTLNRWRHSILEELRTYGMASEQARLLRQIEEAKGRLTLE